VAAHQSGTTGADLAAEFGVHRTIVTALCADRTAGRPSYRVANGSDIPTPHHQQLIRAPAAHGCRHTFTDDAHSSPASNGICSHLRDTHGRPTM
jgi:hypothetical protein